MKQKLIGLTATAVVGSSLLTSIAAADSVTVKSGDTLWEFSQQYNTTVQALKNTNGITNDFIRVGQVLEIPGSSKPTTSVSAPAPASTPKTTSKVITHKVKSGDSLWVIARAYDTSVKDLKELNGLKSDLIRVGQNLTVKKEGVELAEDTQSNDSVQQPVQQPTKTDTTTFTYIVKAGDSLWKIANQTNLTVAEIKVANNLKTDMISIGQVLKLSGEEIITNNNKNVNTEATSPTTNKIDKMISEAKSLISTPYRWGGNTPAGFDCSGYIYYVLNKVTSVSRLSAAGYWDIMKTISTPSVGDFVYFTTYKKGPSHMGIYLGNNEFVHASSSGVTISNLNTSYWKQRYLGAKRFVN
ncbi:MAG: LysM peptidoglycan-binding domain-containing protein [Bacillota bacterium]